MPQNVTSVTNTADLNFEGQQMRDIRKLAVGFLAMALMLAGAAGAQEAKQVDNPYQGEFPFTLGKTITPNVKIDGVVWRALTVSQVGHKELKSGRAIKTRIEIEVENTAEDSARVDIILLFEDDQGNGLDRLELKTFRVYGSSTRTFRQKVKIQADVLKASTKLYLFAEVMR